MTTQQQQPTEPQTEQQQPTPRAEADGSLAERTAYLEGAVGDIPRQLDAQNRSIEAQTRAIEAQRTETRESFTGLRADMDTKFAEQRAEMNAKFAETRESFAEQRTDMRRMEGKLDRLLYAALGGLGSLLIIAIGIIVATILN